MELERRREKRPPPPPELLDLWVSREISWDVRVPPEMSLELRLRWLREWVVLGEGAGAGSGSDLWPKRGMVLDWREVFKFRWCSRC